ncbi:MAG: toprim domain-containing protein [Verrucomicrobia bacterium]|nr:toprim domain-containing protein [Verrucomicrobiota bacterium]
MAKKKSTQVYDESKIKTLSSLEHIRKRTGMYIGRIGDGSHYDDGIYILLKETIDNAIDEFIMGHGTTVEVTMTGQQVTVRDYGRGIPLGKVIECVSRINTGAKYNDDVFQFSVGLNGVGTKAVNALSSEFHVRSVREGQFAEGFFAKGKLLKEKKGKAAGEPNGTLVRFTADPEIFADAAFDPAHVEKRMRLYTYLNAGLAINLNGTRYLSEQGLLDLIAEECDDEAIYPALHFRSKTLELAFTHTQRYNETYLSFVNGQYTSDGGTHLSAFREGVLKAVNEFTKKRYEGDDVREGLVAAVAIRLQEPIFESQTKNKLGNTEIRGDLVTNVKDVVLDLLHRNPDAAQIASTKIEETQKLRKELQSVKKVARERARATSIRVPQLKDSKVHYNQRTGKGEESMLFITEGQSAAGSIISCRDAVTQAVFTLKGKPMNVCELKRDAIYKNDELYNLMRSLQIEDGVSNLRYHKVILATDADVDGMHIRNLLLTFFLRFFEELVMRGHVHILETPLFRVRNKKETRYCYSEAERDEAIQAIGRGHETTRFKGLGEISPGEFKAFISKGMRLRDVRVDHQHDIPDILSFYMGRNTPERRAYIMNHLIVEASA